MSTDDYIKEFNKQVKVVEARKWMLPIVSTSLSEQGKRVFSGVSGSGKRIGRYKSKSYIKKRREKGLPSHSVVLRFTNELQSDFLTAITKIKQGFATGVKKQGSSETATNAEKVGFLAKMYGDIIWKLTKKEKKDFKKRVRAAVTKILS